MCIDAWRGGSLLPAVKGEHGWQGKINGAREYRPVTAEGVYLHTGVMYCFHTVNTYCIHTVHRYERGEYVILQLYCRNYSKYLTVYINIKFNLILKISF
jgi:hypothetical protein